MLVANNILVNPVKGSSHIGSRSYIIAGLSAKASELMGMNRIRLMGCKMTNNKNVIVFLQIVSSLSEKLKYDIIFEFRNIKSIQADSIKDGIFKDKTEMLVFSNSPDFVFTYAFAFNKINAIIPRYKSLLGRAISNAPKIKNPNADIGMPTSLFAGLTYLDSIGFFGNYRYQEFINNKELMPQSFDTITKISNIYRKEQKANNKLKPRVKKIDAKTRYNI